MVHLQTIASAAYVFLIALVGSAEALWYLFKADHRGMPVDIPSHGGTVQAQHPDGNREIRAMCMATLPCPPIPIMASQEDGDESNRTCGEAVANSHDLVAHLMNVRAAAGQEGVNDARSVLQGQVTQALMDRFDAWSAENPGCISPPADVAYEFFAEFTRRYIGCFLNGAGNFAGLRYTMLDSPDVRAHPISGVLVGDPVHRAALGFARAQEAIFGPCREWRELCLLPESGDIPDETPYASLVVLSAMRITTTAEAGGSGA